MRISQLWQYPVKSMAGNQLDKAVLTSRGIQDDRRWMLIDEAGHFLSQRLQLELARWQASVDGDTLNLQHLDSEQSICVEQARATTGPRVRVDVWGSEFWVHELIMADLSLLSAALGFTCRLVYMAEEDERPIDPKYAKAGETVSLSDGYPYLIANEASLEALSKAVGESLDIRRFRPNIVVSDLPAFAEDKWQALQLGDQLFRIPKPCTRCVMITIDPDSLERNPEVFSELAKLHTVNNKVAFGMNACWEGSGEGYLSVG